MYFMHIGVSSCMYVYIPEEGIRFPETTVLDSCELLHFARNEPITSGRAACILNA